LHKLKFTKFCVSLLRERKLPVPTQDTFMFFVCNRFDPHLGGVANFKKDHGFTQGNSRRPVEELAEKIKQVDIANENASEGNSLVEDDQVEDDQVEDYLDEDFDDVECDDEKVGTITEEPVVEKGLVRVEKSVVKVETPKVQIVEPKKEEDYIFLIREVQ